ncbi:monooxygenase family protein [Kitasatospora sp. NBC_00374]|uniref:monooxygenase family protein n=1 Tax=Kitasatospora sp. NBC_00374 TaxID=2975964 RepID=UPI00352F4D12
MKLLAYAYASAREQLHRPAWSTFNRRAREARGKVGVWHETYIVRAGSYETVYVDMPPYGLAAATAPVPVGHRGERVTQRLGPRPAA